MSISTQPVEILRCGRAGFNDRDFSVTYFSEEFASLHFYEYSGDLRIGDQSYDIVPGDISFTPLEFPSQYNVHERGTHFYIHLQAAHNPWLSELMRPMHFRAGVAQRQFRERFQLVQTYLSIPDDSTAREAASLVIQELTPLL